MAVYTTIHEDDLKTFLHEYELGALESYKGIEKGVSNTNYHVYTTVGHYILTIFEPMRVRKEDVQFYLSYALHLQQAGILSAAAIKNKKGVLYGILAGKPAAFVVFLEGQDTQIKEITKEKSAQAGAMLAKMHNASLDFSQKLENRFGQSTLRTWSSRILSKLDLVQYGLGRIIIAEIDYLEDKWPLNMPMGTIHGDFFPDNVFFDKGTVSGVIDFHFACTDYFAYDLAIALNAWSFDDKSAFNKAHFDSLLQAYNTHRVLKNEERQFFQLMLRAAALRFLISRCEEKLSYTEEDLMIPHNPLSFLKRLEFFQNEYIDC